MGGAKWRLGVGFAPTRFSVSVLVILFFIARCFNICIPPHEKISVAICQVVVLGVGLGFVIHRGDGCVSTSAPWRQLSLLHRGYGGQRRWR